MPQARRLDETPAPDWALAPSVDEGEAGTASAADDDAEGWAEPPPVEGAGQTLAVPLSPDELAALVRRVMDQDQAALTALYDALSGRVYASALRITRQVAMAEEVMQDTFWQVWRQAPRFDPLRGNALAWVLNIARSLALDAVRSLQREAQHAQQALQEAQSQTELHGLHEGTADDPMDLLASLRRDTRLQQTLARLDPLKRQLIALAYYRGLTQDEIAAQTGMPLGTVKSHLRRTLAALREALGGESAAGMDLPA